MSTNRNPGSQRLLWCLGALISLCGLLYEYFIRTVDDPHRGMLSGFCYGMMFGGFSCAAWFAGRPHERGIGPDPFSKTPVRAWLLTLLPLTAMVLILLKQSPSASNWPSWANWVFRVVTVAIIVMFIVAARKTQPTSSQGGASEE